jgi:glycosyltransferase involved in cell wall biosynthesis
VISVCLAAYNGERWIAEQLLSVLASPLVDEVVVSDDGSTDGTRARIAEIGDPRIVLIDGPRAGLIRNFENALRHARGDIVFLCDQDDVWLPDKVACVVAALRHADLVVTDCRVVDEALNELHPSFFRLNRSGPGLWRNLLKNGFLGCCMAMRRSVLDAALPFPDRIAMHDWWIGLVAERVGRVRFLAEPLSLYRRHGGNASAASTRSAVPLRQRLRWRLDLWRYVRLHRPG